MVSKLLTTLLVPVVNAKGHHTPNRVCLSSESDTPIAHNLHKYIEIVD